MNFKIGALLASAACLTFSLSASAAQCGKVSIADLTWNSATLTANIDKFILTHGYGCDAELIASDSVPAMASMTSKGTPDIAPEMWTNAFKSQIEKGVKNKQLHLAGKSLLDGGQEGFWVPAYLVKQYPELKTIAGIRKHPELFPDKEDPDHAAFYSCPAGWNCQISSQNLFKALKLNNSGFHIVDPGSSAGLTGAISKAYEDKKGWFGYYWEPSAILGKYKMVHVNLQAKVDEKEFTKCTTQANCEHPKVTAYPPAPVYTLTTEKFAQRAPQVMAYLNKRGFTNPQMNKLLAWMDANQADGEMTMYHFLENYPKLWHQWVPDDVAKKVEAAL